MLITDEYRDLNRKLHKTDRTYGSKTHKTAPMLPQIVSHLRLDYPVTVLDYGCGKGGLDDYIKSHLAEEYIVSEYDPCYAGKEADPGPAQLVVSHDVLEHVEPECIDEVLAHIFEKAEVAFYCILSCQPFGGELADGTNPHRIVKPATWWVEKLKPWFLIKQDDFYKDAKKEFKFLAIPRKGVFA